eukprot:TRINITY_DN4164_c0_g2_i2.p1 TRINITY_DN4164_c0_g2~~TRINITY_DN4164_c0_g2_i2.p1  ORF type:complete len:387 (-),score=103.74 TRINITY_DN4164_c0_g2_i2:50-1210(-)
MSDSSSSSSTNQHTVVWAKDDSSETCTSCSTKFTFLKRRHHCRRCGGLYCNDCCSLLASLPQGYNTKSRSRVCNKCFKLTVRERARSDIDIATIHDGGPSTETKMVSSVQKVIYWKMGTREGAIFDRSTIDSVENQVGLISVQKLQDLMIEGELGNTVRLRVYTPDRKLRKMTKHPVLLWFHTGNFCTRGIESPSVDGLCRLLANQVPCVVISVEYRLAPENPYPAAVEDAYSALCWAARNVMLNYDADNRMICVGGDGAGGNIAASLCLMARDKGIPANGRIVAQCLITPPLDLSPGSASKYESRMKHKDGYMISGAQLSWFHAQYLGSSSSSSDPYASPLLAVDFSRLPPALIIGAGYDPFFSEGLLFPFFSLFFSLFNNNKNF